MGPDQGASMLWSNNAEDIYAFEINRVEPLRIPGLLQLTGPFRYDFFAGSLKGHEYPNDPWVHVEKISFKPTRNLEFGFDRMAI
jgi:Capsule assembly protein Wzi